MIHAWANGAFLAAGHVPTVSVLDRGYTLGDSIFETLRARDGVEIAWSAHLDLLESAAAALELTLPFDRVALLDAARELVLRHAAPDVTVRITASRGEGGQGVSPRGCGAPFVSVITRPTKPYPPEHYEHGIDATIVGTRRIPSACVDSRFKTGCYLPSVLAKMELDRKGLVEGIMLSSAGFVSSGCVSNVFCVLDGTVITPNLESDCREGVTRARVLACATQLGLPIAVRRIEVDELNHAQEMFFTNTLMDCLPVRSLDDRRYTANGPVTTLLSGALQNERRPTS